jgi:hypothetical protein
VRAEGQRGQRKNKKICTFSERETTGGEANIPAEAKRIINKKSS